MSFEPFMWVTFCDDIRQEVGNKLSIMGIYGANLIVPSFPTVLPKLCCVFNVRVPANAVPRHVAFKLLRGEEVIFEAELSHIDNESTLVQLPPGTEDSHALTIGNVAQFVNFAVTEQALLKARALVDGKELRGGSPELLASSPTKQ